MKRKRFSVVLLVIVFVLTAFSGCSAKSESVGSNGEDYWYGALYDGASGTVAETITQANKSESISTANQKLVRKMSIEAETNDLDAMLVDLNSRVNSLGGYVENRSVRNGSSTATRRYRHAELTIRVPADKLDAFVEHINDQTNVVYYTESADDITLRYVATQSRVTALETEQQRLLELLEKAENMSDLLQIEERLTNVRTELEEVTSQMRLYDNMVDYGTIQLTVTEVQEYTAVEEQTVWQKIGSGLSDNWKNLCDGAEAVFVFLVTSVPYLIPVSAAIIITVIAVKAAMRKPKKKEVPPAAKEEE